jgi:hypothetical protein
MPLQKYWKQNHRLTEMSIVAMLLALFASTVPAEHEADHRYDVRGYVLDAQKNPRSGVPVTILMGDATIGSGRTDSKGFYSIRLHLHDSDIGKSLKVRAGNAQADIRMQAKHGDQTTARFHHVNFVGREFVEEKLSTGGVPAWAYIAAAPVVLWAGVYMTGAMRRKIRKTKSTQRRKKKGKPKG